MMNIDISETLSRLQSLYKNLCSTYHPRKTEITALLGADDMQTQERVAKTHSRTLEG